MSIGRRGDDFALVRDEKLDYDGGMTAPSVDAETLARYFHPLLPETWDDPVVGPVLRRLAETSPEVIAAVTDVDRSLIFDALAMTTEQRVAQSMHRAAFIEAMREAK